MIRKYDSSTDQSDSLDKVTKRTNDKSISSSLFSAVQYGKLETVRKLINTYGLSYSPDWFEGYALLVGALMSSRTEVAKLLITSGCRLNKANDKPDETPLHFAVMKEYIHIIEMLVNKGADINLKAKNNITPLHIASKVGNARIVEILLNHGASTDSLALIKGYTPLMIAINSKNESIVKLFLQHETNIDSQDKDGQTILNLAVKSKSLIIVEDVLKHCPDINNKNNRSSLKTAVLGCGRNCKNIVKTLLEYGLTVDPEDANVPNLLINAVKNEYVKIIKDLLKYGADVNAQDSDGKTPIYYAINNRNLKIVELLLANKAKIKDNPELLSDAVESCQIEIVKALLENDADIIHLNDKCKQTALHSIKYHIHDIASEIAILLLSKGVNIHTKNESGETPLHLSARGRNIKILKILLNKGANVHAKTNNGLTPLHIAINVRCVEVLEVLLEYSTKISKNNNHNTLFHMTCGHLKTNYYEIVETLINFDVDINSKDEYGRTPLQIAIENGNEGFVSNILQLGTDINIKTSSNITPLNYAKQRCSDYNRECENCGNNYSDCKFRVIVGFLNSHIFKMKAVNFHVLDNPSQPCDELLKEINYEIECMKSEKIDANVSFYDILTKGTNSLQKYMRNENIVQVLKSQEYGRIAPMYYSMINNNFRKSMKRKKLLELSDAILHSLFKNYPQLPYICMEKILSFLDNEDLKTFLDLEPSSYVTYYSYINENNGFL